MISGFIDQKDPLGAPIAIGSLQSRSAVFLAPMSGVSDVPFRRAAWKAGAGMVTSEMVASEALVTGKAEMQVKAESAGLPIHMVQLAGREAKWMDHAARLAEASGADIIDINMGCPARKVTNGYSGSALMRDLDHALGLIEAVVKAVRVPVTLKMRLGWDHDSINAPELARRAQDAGVQLLTVHGRTRCQFYKAKADWAAVQAVCETADLPVIVNGDIQSRADALAAQEISGADGVMIGRATYGQPHLCGQIANFTDGEGNAPAYDVVEHVSEMIEFYGDYMGVRCARKHIGWYLERERGLANKRVRHELMACEQPQILVDRLAELVRSIEQNSVMTRAAA
jgi:nifR3 family TIM-barrel protein